MNRWHEHLFGPVAAIRPNLLVRVFALLLAADIWLTFIIRGPNHGVGGFDVAHFAWLDAVQPAPSPSLYIAVMIIASFALWLIAWRGVQRGLMTVATILFTYGWAMSQSDSYQHHYLISLVLLCMCFFPKESRLNISESDGRSPRSLIPAWAYVMLGTQIAIVYLWTSIAKMDSEWMHGAFVRRLMTHDAVHPAFKPMQEFLASFSLTWVWPAVAVGTIVLELALCAGYLYALGQDRRTGKRSRTICVILWILAVGFHGGLLLMPLSIGLFGLYMILFATIFHMPSGILNAVARWITAAVNWLINACTRVSNPVNSKALAVAESLVIAAVMAWMGFQFDLPGTRVGMSIAGGLMVVMTLCDVRGNSVAMAQRVVLAGAVFLTGAAGMMYPGQLRYQINSFMAHLQHFAGEPREAFRYYAKAIQQRPNSEEAGKLYNNLGDVLREMKLTSDAIEWYEAALKLNADDAFAHGNLGVTLLELHRTDEAIQHFREAARLNPASATTRYNFACALQAKNQIEEAIEQYREAVKLDPGMLAAHANLAGIYVLRQQMDEARAEFLEVLRLDPEDLSALNNLAWMLATKTDRTPADVAQALEFAERAATLAKRQNPVILGTLAESLHASGRFDEATATLEQAIRMAQSQKQDSVAAQLKSRLDRYHSSSAGSQ